MLLILKFQQPYSCICPPLGSRWVLIMGPFRGRVRTDCSGKLIMLRGRRESALPLLLFGGCWPLLHSLSPLPSSLLVIVENIPCLYHPSYVPGRGHAHEASRSVLAFRSGMTRRSTTFVRCPRAAYERFRLRAGQVLPAAIHLPIPCPTHLARSRTPVQTCVPHVGRSNNGFRVKSIEHRRLVAVGFNGGHKGL